jgi:hypothetical protein
MTATIHPARYKQKHWVCRDLKLDAGDCLFGQGCYLPGVAIDLKHNQAQGAGAWG